MRRQVRIVAIILALLLAACAGTPVATAPVAAPSAPTLAGLRAGQRAAAGLRSAVLRVDGVDIAYSEGGAASGEVVVLLHGFTGSRDHWNEVAAQLAGSYRLVIPDLPGHGDTRVPAGYTYMPGETGDVLRHFIEALGIRRYHLVGHSMGGGLAIPLALFDREQVQSLALLGSAGVYATNDAPLMRRIEAGENPLVIRQPGQLRPLLAELMEQPPPFEPWLLDALEQDRIARQAEYDMLFAQLRLTASYFTPEAFRANLRFIRAPVLLLWGAQDRIFAPAVIEEMRPHFRRPPQVEVLADVGHTLPLEAPAQVAGLLDAFFAAHADAQPAAAPR